MINADKFKTVFGIYSEEFWAKSESDMLNWINSEYQEPRSKVNIQLMKHGRWENSIAKYGILIHICSVCNKYSHMAYNYCPNCGAKMDGEENV